MKKNFMLISLCTVRMMKFNEQKVIKYFLYILHVKFQYIQLMSDHFSKYLYFLSSKSKKIKQLIIHFDHTKMK